MLFATTICNIIELATSDLKIFIDTNCVIARADASSLFIKMRLSAEVENICDVYVQLFALAVFLEKCFLNEVIGKKKKNTIKFSKIGAGSDKKGDHREGNAEKSGRNFSLGGLLSPDDSPSRKTSTSCLLLVIRRRSSIRESISDLLPVRVLHLRKMRV